VAVFRSIAAWRWKMDSRIGLVLTVLQILQTLSGQGFDCGIQACTITLPIPLLKSNAYSVP